MTKFIGLSSTIYELKLVASKAKPFPHILFKGPRGCGKTTLSRYIGEITSQRFIEVNSPSLDKKKLYTLLLSTKRNDIIFIDEIHRLNPATEEILYQPLESGTLTIPCGQRLMTVKFPAFTLIGATTRPALVSKPLLSRFHMAIEVPQYTVRDLARIVMNAYGLSAKDALKITMHTMVPREALLLAKRVLNLNMGVDRGLQFLNFKNGLSIEERNYLKHLASGRTISLQTLASYLQYDVDSVTLLEERLMRMGLVEITGRGRELTALGMVKVQEA